MARENGVNRGGAEERSQGQAGGGKGALTAGEGDGEDAEEGGGERSQKQGEEGRRGTEPGGDHGDEFDVAQAQAFLVADEEVEPADQEQEEGGEDRPDCRDDEAGNPCCPQRKSEPSSRIQDFYQPGWEDEGSWNDAEERRCNSGVENSQHDARQGKRIRQPHGLGIHDGEAEEQETKNGHSDGNDAKSEAQKAEEEERGGGELDGWVSPGDWPAAGSAAAAKENPAENRNVVGGLDPSAAARATRAWVNDGFVARQAGDADVEEAAEGEAEEHGEDGDEQVRGASP